MISGRFTAAVIALSIFTAAGTHVYTAVKMRAAEQIHNERMAELQLQHEQNERNRAAFEKLKADMEAFEAELAAQEEATRKANEELARRAADAAEASRGTGRFITVEATAYTCSEDECGKADGITASGRQAVPHYTVASDNLPIGTKLVIDGQLHEVMDRIGEGNPRRIDINMRTKEEARNFGRRIIKVEVLE